MRRRSTRATATLEIEVEHDSPAGTLDPEDGETRPFSGWIELAAAIEEWRAQSRTGSANAICADTAENERRVK